MLDTIILILLSSNSLNSYNFSLFNTDEQITFKNVQYIIYTIEFTCIIKGSKTIVLRSPENYYPSTLPLRPFKGYFPFLLSIVHRRFAHVLIDSFSPL